MNKNDRNFVLSGSGPKANSISTFFAAQQFTASVMHHALSHHAINSPQFVQLNSIFGTAMREQARESYELPQDAPEFHHVAAPECVLCDEKSEYIIKLETPDGRIVDEQAFCSADLDLVDFNIDHNGIGY